MTPSTEPAVRQFIKRCNGAEPGELLDEVHAEAALRRAADNGFEIFGSLVSGSAAWRNEVQDLTFSLTEATEADAQRRQHKWGI
ncbi:hypothetical protein Caci_4022 [Catenulispora acidiphila DSM 44928]|uniref:Uncharacterized protein n=1 Tax=Catenulispora acidiphila (strain DSM 44928 / JCM 14897 / NBRC 102108 / NRRL B-24433 / ID139908) TaxID=479433 RepID=C7QEX0_CATAD|nr:hypothetical protein [Catenulispora acidiphila]ACU72890.1 hypothetical protein Caci_4022 [Catenulispora acidiphila DSM 44928]